MAGMDGVGLHALTWQDCDERFGEVLVASPTDARGRGIALTVKVGGVVTDLTGAMVYLLWRHRVARTRGCEPFRVVDAAKGRCDVFYPSSMTAAEGAVDAQLMVSLPTGNTISSRTFEVNVGQVLVGGTQSVTDFTLFLKAIKGYETAAAGALGVADELRAARAAGEFDGAAGAAGPKGDRGDVGPAGAKGETGPAGAQGPIGPTGAKGDVGATGATGPKGDTGPTGATGAQGTTGIAGTKGDRGDAFTYADFTAAQLAGLTGPKGDKGDVGAKGDAGAKGDQGPQGIQGPAGKDGTTPDLTAYATIAYVDGKISGLANLEGMTF